MSGLIKLKPYEIPGRIKWGSGNWRKTEFLCLSLSFLPAFYFPFSPSSNNMGPRVLSSLPPISAADTSKIGALLISRHLILQDQRREGVELSPEIGLERRKDQFYQNCICWFCTTLRMVFNVNSCCEGTVTPHGYLCIPDRSSCSHSEELSSL